MSEQLPAPRPKRGDIREDGKRFWSRVHGEEYWVTPEHFQKLKDRKYEWRQQNLDKERATARRWREANPELSRARALAQYYANPEKHRQRFQQWERNNKELRSQYRKRMRKTNPLAALRMSLRTRMWAAFTRAGSKRPSGLSRVLGAEVFAVKDHIESRFQPGMSWENYGQWHVDHIIPLASAKAPEELVALCHYTNLQPLWAKDNLRKGAKIEGRP